MIFYKVGPRQKGGAHSPARSLRRTTGRIEVVRLPSTSLWGYGESLRSRAILVMISFAGSMRSATAISMNPPMAAMLSTPRPHA
jgi:hypothetical protein